MLNAPAFSYNTLQIFILHPIQKMTWVRWLYLDQPMNSDKVCDLTSNSWLFTALNICLTKTWEHLKTQPVYTLTNSYTCRDKSWNKHFLVNNLERYHLNRFQASWYEWEVTITHVYIWNAAWSACTSKQTDHIFGKSNRKDSAQKYWTECADHRLILASWIKFSVPGLPGQGTAAEP